MTAQNMAEMGEGKALHLDLVPFLLKWDRPTDRPKEPRVCLSSCLLARNGSKEGKAADAGGKCKGKNNMNKSALFILVLQKSVKMPKEANYDLLQSP